MKKILMSIIRFYQRYISPATQPTCRYHPTCSSYALEAVDKHGALKGSVMGGARILRCNPFVEGGVDKVPDYFTVKRNPENIDKQHIPEYLLSADSETKKEIKELREQYCDRLKVSESLPNSLKILKRIARLEVLNIKDIEDEFTLDELEYLEDIQVLPNLSAEDYQCFTLLDHPVNKEYLQEVTSYDEGVLLGKDHPLIVLEKTGIWYTNLPRLFERFLIERGVTEEDLENNSYHLWMVLKAIENENN